MYLSINTNQDLIDRLMDGEDGTIELLPEPLAGGYKTLKQHGLTVDANGLLGPVGRWRLSYLSDSDTIGTSQDPRF
jgi:hypothetical protein